MHCETMMKEGRNEVMQRNELMKPEDESSKQCSADATYSGSSRSNNSTAVLTSSTSSQLDYSFRKSTSPGSEFKNSIRASSQSSSVRHSQELNDLTANKLRFANVGFYGRQNEMSILLNVLEKCAHTNGSDAVAPSPKSKELVLIEGYSGVGKSTFANQLEKAVKEKYSGIYATGKFDLLNKETPYSAISEAYGSVFWQIIKESYRKSPSPIAACIQESIAFELDNEQTKLLGSLIPGLKEFCKQDYCRSADKKIPHSFEPQDDKADNKTDDPVILQEQLKYAIRVLTRILTTFVSPLVIALDDLQWMDVASSNIIETLITDEQNPNSLIIMGTYRSNEVDETSLLSRTLHQIREEMENSKSFGLTQIELENLGVDETNHIIMALLSIDDELYTLELAEVCHHRTHGNPFFLIEFVKMLLEKELLDFNLGLFQWTWDIPTVKHETASTENVVNMLQAKMRLMPPKAQKLLSYAACLESTFRLKELTLVWQQLEDKDTSDLCSLLLSLEEGLLIEPSNYEWSSDESNAATLSYRWVHDKVQEAALSLVGDKDDLAKQHFDMGLALYRSFDKNEMEKLIFNVVNLINYGSKNIESVDFASLNLCAAEKAKGISAFTIAANYASAGIKLLPKNNWAVNHSLTVRLYSIGAEMHSAIGEVDTMNSYCNYVLQHEQCSALDKLSVCKTKGNSLAKTERKYKEAIDLCMDQLKHLGCNFPRSNCSIACRTLPAVVRTVQATKNESIRNMSVITEPTMLATMELLDRVNYYGYMSSNSLLFLLSLTKILHLTNMHGICPVSPSAFVCWGMVMGSLFGKYSAGSEFAEKAIRMQEKLISKNIQARTLCITYVLVYPWTYPLHDSLTILKDKVYKEAIQAGEVESAMLALVVSNVTLPLILGRNLKRIKDGCNLVMTTGKQLKTYDNLLFSRMILQAIMNLTESSNENDAIVLRGEAFNEENTEFSTPIDKICLNYIKSLLCVVFGEHESGAALAIKKGEEFSKQSPGNLAIVHDAFLRGISLYAMAQKTDNKKFVKNANKIRKKIKSWMKKGNPNVARYASLLNAEQAVLDKKFDKAESLYRDAIKISARAGNLLDGGIANERYAEFLLHVILEKDSGKETMNKAIRLYDDWGASRKVVMLQRAQKLTLTEEEKRSLPSSISIDRELVE